MASTAASLGYSTIDVTVSWLFSPLFNVSAILSSRVRKNFQVRFSATFCDASLGDHFFHAGVVQFIEHSFRRKFKMLKKNTRLVRESWDSCFS